MKLNKLEFLAMNNWLRAIIQDKYELKILREMSEIGGIKIALEIGCGNGHGAELIKKYFQPAQLIGIDLDEKMIRRAAQKHQNDNTIQLKVMDASRLEFPDNYFDAIFDFGVIHHIPNWKDCIVELKRVLKPGGELVAEDLSIDTFRSGAGRIWKSLLTHPYEQMYSNAEFKKQLLDVGFTILNYKEFNPLKLIKHFSLTARAN